MKQQRFQNWICDDALPTWRRRRRRRGFSRTFELHARQTNNEWKRLEKLLLLFYYKKKERRDDDLSLCWLHASWWEKEGGWKVVTKDDDDNVAVEEEEEGSSAEIKVCECCFCWIERQKRWTKGAAAAASSQIKHKRKQKDRLFWRRNRGYIHNTHTHIEAHIEKKKKKKKFIQKDETVQMRIFFVCQMLIEELLIISNSCFFLFVNFKNLKCFLFLIYLLLTF